MLSAVAAILVGLAWASGALSPLERPVADALVRLPSPRSPGVGAVSAVLIDDPSVKRFGPLPWPRMQLAELIKRTRDLGAAGVVVDILLSEAGFEPADFSLKKEIEGGPIVLAATLGSDGSWILPTAEFGGIQYAAHANAEIEGDGVIRTFSFTKQSEGLALEAMSVAAARLAGWQGISSPGLVFRPDFLERPSEIPRLSALDILNDESAPQALDGKIVFLGVSATGSTDQFVTAVSRWHQPTPGVLVHAAAASSLIRGGLIQQLKPRSAWFLAFLAALAIQVFRSAAGRLRAWHLLAVALAILAGSTLALWVLGFLLPVVGLLLAAIVSAFLREVAESRDVQSETGKILHSLVREGRTEFPSPRGAQERLRLAHLLQERIINDRNLRRTLLDGLGEGVILWDPEGRPLISNQAFGRIWGDIPTLPEMLQTTGSSFSDIFNEETAEIDLQYLRQSLQVRFRILDGGHLAVVRDISAQRELDKQRREMQRLVSHELKTPLASLAGFGSLLERYTLTEEELRHTAGMIRSEAERLGEMVRTFLDLERLGAGHHDEKLAPVDLAALTKERCSVLSAFAHESKVHLETKFDEPAMVFGAPLLLSQVVDNLIGNAIKFAPAGTTVEVNIFIQQDATVLSVRDFGPGIPPEALPHLFERFYRVPGSETQGTGLGLALVQEVAEHHQAEVSVESTVGEGSIFTVTFPGDEPSKEMS